LVLEATVFAAWIYISSARALYLDCPNEKQVSNLWVPRFCKHINADIICTKNFGPKVHSGGMLLGDVVDAELNVELKGEYVLQSGICEHIRENGGKTGEEVNPEKVDHRQLDINYGIGKRDWPDALVYYEVEDGFSEAIQIQIEAAIWMWTQSSPARFHESTTATNRIVLTPVDSSTCLSYVGMIGGSQVVYLNADGGCNVGRIAHEIGHAIGFYHEHTRPDRLNYITINEDNILSSYTVNYEEVTGKSYAAHPYDYGSLLHYPVTGSGGAAISVVDAEFDSYLEVYGNNLPDETLGQRYFMSSIDKTMGYTYMGHNCVDNDADIGDSSAYEWDVGEWGGCEAQCPLSFRQRGVYCRLNGECQLDSACNATERPVSRKPCELSAETRNVTFDENRWADKGVPMQNVGLYDQFDWYLHRGHPIDFSGDQDSIEGISSRGPGVDGDGNTDGHYVWFTSMRPAVENDEAWFESPIIRTDGEEACTVDFKFFNAGEHGFLTVETVSCDDCGDTNQLWRSSKGVRNSGWQDKSLTVSAETTDVRLRFVANRGNDGTGEIGLDNIVFGEGCYRADADLEDAYADFDFYQNISSPYEWDYDCIFWPGWGWSWTTAHICYVSAGAAGFLCCLILWIEIGIKIHKRLRAKKGMKHASDHEEFHYHQQKAKQDNPLVLIKHSFNGLMARFHRVAMAFQDARRKAREQEYEEFEDMVHTNKSARTVEEKQADEEEAKRLKKKSYLHRQKVKLHHWLDQVGTIDRIEHILFIISFGKIKEIAILHPQYKQSGGQRLQQPKKSKKKTGIEPSYESESLVDDSTHHEG